MSRQREKWLLRHCNRGLIASLSLLGMLLDGLQLSDLLLQGAALIWLWTPELQMLESAWWHRLRRRQRASGRLDCEPSA